jgi:hypothetical protein
VKGQRQNKYLRAIQLGIEFGPEISRPKETSAASDAAEGQTPFVACDEDLPAIFFEEFAPSTQTKARVADGSENPRAGEAASD